MRRLLINYFFTTVFTLYCLAKLSIKGNISVAGLYAGIIVGLVGSIFMLISLGRSARKHVFALVSRNPKKAFVVMFFIIVPIVTVSAGSILLILKYYFAQINWGNIWITFLVVAFAVFSTTCTVGVYCLERRYGKKFYLGKRG